MADLPEIVAAFDPIGYRWAMERGLAASAALTKALELPAATWEPHDWRDFD